MVGWHHPADKTPVKDPRSRLSGRAHIVKQALVSPFFDQKRKLSFVWKKRKKREKKKGRKGEKRKEKEMRFLLMPPAACVLSHFSHVRLFTTLWIVARQAPLCMEF